MKVLTGAAGFIASCLLGKLNKEGINDIVISDDFSREEKVLNWQEKLFINKVDRDDLPSFIEENYKEIDFVFHLGARTNTAEFDKKIFDKLNLNYTKQLWEQCSKYNIPFLYASSAATYGMGEFGYDDNHDIVESLKPLNPYGDSKNDFDKWMLKQEKTPPFWAGLKFFNVYGPNEYHKTRMASVIFHAFNQIKKTDKMKLFRSHKEEYKDGEQLRDFVYVKDVVDVCYFLMQNKPNSGIYNLGTGKARSFLDLTKATFKAMDVNEDISFIDTPEDIRDKYQYFTEAKMQKLINAGYKQGFYSLEEGVEDYVKNYLIPNKYL